MLTANLKTPVDTYTELKKHFLPKGDGAIAHWLSINPSTLAEWKAQDKIPTSYLEHVEERLKELALFRI